MVEGLTGRVHDMPHQQIRGYTYSGDLQWTCDAYLVTVNCVLLCTIIEASKEYKFSDVPYILLYHKIGDWEVREFLAIKWVTGNNIIRRMDSVEDITVY
jgi:hypothetical protein